MGDNRVVLPQHAGADLRKVAYWPEEDGVVAWSQRKHATGEPCIPCVLVVNPEDEESARARARSAGMGLVFAKTSMVIDGTRMRNFPGTFLPPSNVRHKVAAGILVVHLDRSARVRVSDLLATIRAGYPFLNNAFLTAGLHFGHEYGLWRLDGDTVCPVADNG